MLTEEKIREMIDQASKILSFWECRHEEALKIEDKTARTYRLKECANFVRTTRAEINAYKNVLSEQ